MSNTNFTFIRNVIFQKAFQRLWGKSIIILGLSSSDKLFPEKLIYNQSTDVIHSSKRIELECQAFISFETEERDASTPPTQPLRLLYTCVIITVLRSGDVIDSFPHYFSLYRLSLWYIPLTK